MENNNFIFGCFSKLRTASAVSGATRFLDVEPCGIFMHIGARKKLHGKYLLLQDFQCKTVSKENLLRRILEEIILN